MQKKNSAKIGRGHITVKDLAFDLGLSVSTVSRAFYPESGIAEKTRETVLNYAREVGYRTNVFAKSLVTKNTQIVGVVAADLTNPYYPEIMTKLTAMLQQKEINVMLSTATESDQIDASVDLLLAYQPSVIIILAANCASAARQKCELVGIPCIFFNRLSSDGQGIGVSCDNYKGGESAAEFFYDQGHRSLGYVSAFPGASTNIERREGFIHRAVELGLKKPMVLDAGAFSYEKGFEASAKLKGIKNIPTAFFCANDIVAIGFKEGVEFKLGLNVPKDISIIGFDDIEMARWPSHNLTTVPQPTDNMLSKTIEIVQEISLKERNFTNFAEPIKIAPGEIIERQTTKKRRTK